MAVLCSIRLKFGVTDGRSSPTPRYEREIPASAFCVSGSMLSESGVAPLVNPRKDLSILSVILVTLDSVRAIDGR